MKLHWFSPSVRAVTIGGFLLSALVAASAVNSPRSPVHGAAFSRRAPLPGYASLPLSFEPNVGQTDSRVQFVSRGSGYAFFLAGNEAVLSVGRAHLQPPTPGLDHLRQRQPRRPLGQSAVRMRLVGADMGPRAEGSDPLPGHVNYFLGNDPSRCRTGVRTCARVRRRNVWPGIDLVFYGSHSGRLEHDFVVHPGANPDRIRLEYAGARSVQLDGQGDLLPNTPAGEIRHAKPVVYQEVGGRRQPVSGSYAVDEHSSKGASASSFRVSFVLGAYDRKQALVVDPVVYSTYVGGSANDGAYALAVDPQGNALVGGITYSTNSPVTAGAIQSAKLPPASLPSGFLTKLDPNGIRLYSTYLGGSGNSGAFGDVINAVTADAWGAGLRYRQYLLEGLPNYCGGLPED